MMQKINRSLTIFALILCFYNPVYASQQPLLGCEKLVIGGMGCIVAGYFGFAGGCCGLLGRTPIGYAESVKSMLNNGHAGRPFNGGGVANRANDQRTGRSDFYGILRNAGLWLTRAALLPTLVGAAKCIKQSWKTGLSVAGRNNLRYAGCVGVAYSLFMLGATHFLAVSRGDKSAYLVGAAVALACRNV